MIASDLASSDFISADHPHTLCVRDAVASTFAMFCGEAPVYTGAQESTDGSQIIIGTIALIGDASSSVMLCLPRDTATALSAKFAGFEIPFDGPDMADVVGELTNVSAGAIVAGLEGIGVRVHMSLPTVVRGTDITFPLPEGFQRVQINFDSPDGLFFVQLVAGDPHTVRRTVR